MSRRILTVVGARPQLVKAAAVSRVLASRDGIEEVLVHTGQHHDHGMSQVFFDELGIPAPDHDLGVHGGTHAEMTARMLPGLEALMVDHAPDVVLVYGDTNSTLAAALAAAKLHLPIAHVEAGLRSFNRAMPEEINRIVTDHVSALLLCPTRAALANLAAEGLREGVWHVGDVMCDAALFAARRAATASTILEDLGLTEGGFALATVHRAENTGSRDALSRVVEYLKRRGEDRPVVLPLHPRTRAAAARLEVDLGALTVIEPVGYLDMTRLVSTAAEVLTDSGGLQKEAYFHRVPCVTLRSETEWVETIEHGWNRLWEVEGYADRRPIDDYGSGDAASRICDLLARCG